MTAISPRKTNLERDLPDDRSNGDGVEHQSEENDSDTDDLFMRSKMHPHLILARLPVAEAAAKFKESYLALGKDSKTEKRDFWRLALHQRYHHHLAYSSISDMRDVIDPEFDVKLILPAGQDDSLDRIRTAWGIDFHTEINRWPAIPSSSLLKKVAPVADVLPLGQFVSRMETIITDRLLSSPRSGVRRDTVLTSRDMDSYKAEWELNKQSSPAKKKSPTKRTLSNAGLDKQSSDSMTGTTLASSSPRPKRARKAIPAKPRTFDIEIDDEPIESDIIEFSQSSPRGKTDKLLTKYGKKTGSSKDLIHLPSTDSESRTCIRDERLYQYPKELSYSRDLSTGTGVSSKEINKINYCTISRKEEAEPTPKSKDVLQPALGHEMLIAGREDLEKKSHSLQTSHQKEGKPPSRKHQETIPRSSESNRTSLTTLDSPVLASNTSCMSSHLPALSALEKRQTGQQRGLPGYRFIESVTLTPLRTNEENGFCTLQSSPLSLTKDPLTSVKLAKSKKTDSGAQMLLSTTIETLAIPSSDHESVDCVAPTDRSCVSGSDSTRAGDRHSQGKAKPNQRDRSFVQRCRHALASLASEGYLNDEVVNLSLEIFATYPSSRKTSPCIVASSFYIPTKIKDGEVREEVLQRFTSKAHDTPLQSQFLNPTLSTMSSPELSIVSPQNMTSPSLDNQSTGSLASLICPIFHEGESHWSLVEIDVDQGTVYHFDSLRDQRRSRKTAELIRPWISGVEATLKHSAREQSISSMNCPQQTDGVSCGVFILIFGQCLINGVPIPSVVGPEALAHARKLLCRMFEDLIVSRDNIRRSIADLTVIGVRDLTSKLPRVPTEQNGMSTPKDNAESLIKSVFIKTPGSSLLHAGGISQHDSSEKLMRPTKSEKCIKTTCQSGEGASSDITDNGHDLSIITEVKASESLLNDSLQTERMYPHDQRTNKSTNRPFSDELDQCNSPMMAANQQLDIPKSHSMTKIPDMSTLIASASLFRRELITQQTENGTKLEKAQKSYGATVKAHSGACEQFTLAESRSTMGLCGELDSIAMKNKITGMTEAFTLVAHLQESKTRDASSVSKYERKKSHLDDAFESLELTIQSLERANSEESGNEAENAN